MKAVDVGQAPARLRAVEDLLTLAWLHAAERDARTWLALGEAGFPDGLSLVAPGQAAAAGMLGTALRDLIGEAAAGLPAADDRLAADYAAIYLTHALRASPCESVWRDEDHLMMQEPTFEVRRCYREHGVAVAPEGPLALPDDHLATELSFCAHLLAQGETQALLRFLDDHLLRWLPEFAARVVRRADTAVYAGLAALTEETVRRLRQTLGCAEEAAPKVQ